MKPGDLQGFSCDGRSPGFVRRFRKFKQGLKERVEFEDCIGREVAGTMTSNSSNLSVQFQKRSRVCQVTREVETRKFAQGYDKCMSS